MRLRGEQSTIMYGLIGITFLGVLFLRPAAHISPLESAEPHQRTSKAVVDASSNRIRGIDVSHYQGNVDWSKVLNAGVSFVFLKATDGRTYTDPRFQAHFKALQALDIPMGAYHFFEPRDGGIQQAEHYLGTVSVQHGSLPPVLDVEVTHGLEPRAIRSGVRQWLQYVETHTGCRPMIYTNKAFWEKNLSSEFQAYPLWLAEYEAPPTPPTGVTSWPFWQYSERGRMPGIQGKVDLNLFGGDRAQLNQLRCPQGKEMP